MNKTVALLLAIGVSSVPSADSDVESVRELLRVAAAGPQEQLRPRLEKIALSLQNAELRAKTSGALDAIVAAAELHRKISEIEREVTELGGLVKVEAGGPGWLRSLVGEAPMKLFDRLVTVSMNDRTNPHFKDYRLNTKVNDAWVVRLDGLTDLRSLDLANMDIRGAGLTILGKLQLESINLTLTPITDESLTALSGVSTLKVLGLASTKTTGTGMGPLGGLRKLENLNFHSCPVNDAGLEQVGKLSSLIRLEIVHTQFTDAGAKFLSGLTNLERLQLGSRKATGAGLAFLRDLPRLRELDVHDGMLTPEGFRHVGAVATLRVLRAYGGSADDEGLRPLAGLADLETLILENTGITDASIETLPKLPRLKKLTIREPKVTADALSRLRAALPAVEVIR